MTEPYARPVWIGVVIKYADGRTEAIEMLDDGGAIEGPAIEYERRGASQIHFDDWPEYFGHTMTLRLVTHGQWHVYQHDESTDDPFKATVAIEGGEK